MIAKFHSSLLEINQSFAETALIKMILAILEEDLKDQNSEVLQDPSHNLSKLLMEYQKSSLIS